MEKIIGTLLTIEQLLENKDTDIVIDTPTSPNERIYKLDKGRRYIIPNYQREIRWDEPQLSDLINDIMGKKQFLGNVILSRKGNDYEIIDGQQRITVLRMLIKYLYATHPYAEDYFKKYELCPLIIDSFEAFPAFEANNYKISEEIKEKVEASDDYHQYPRYTNLWDLMSKSDILATPENKKDFLERLFAAKINIIINNDNTSKFEVEYFVDVNQKGVQLDVEDTLKGYLFQIKSPKIKEKWVAIKKQCHLICETIQMKSSDFLLLMVEQYFYSELYKETNNTKLTFKQDFLLTANFNVGTKTYLKGSHLIPAIANSRNLIADLGAISKILDVVNMLVSNPTYTGDFGKLFNPQILSGENKLSDKGQICIFDLLKKILIDSNDVPKILAVKYISDILLNKEIHNKKLIDKADFDDIKAEYQAIFSLYALFTLFSLSATKKQRDKLYDCVKGPFSQEKISNAIDWFLSKESVLKSKYSNSYRIFSKEQENNLYADSLRCKSMALLYNYLIYDNTRKRYTFCKHGEMYDFLQDKTQYTLEHFLLNQSKKCEILNSPHENCNYPKEVEKYIGSCFNFIYIHQNINGAILGNRCLHGKLSILNKEGDTYESLTRQQKETVEKFALSCEYSKKIVSMLKNKGYFKKYYTASANSKDALSSYFSTDFTDEYISFVDDVVIEFYSKLKKAKK